MTAPISQTSPESATMPKMSLRWRVVAWTALLLVLAIGFVGYFMPGVRLNWETIAAMCGF